MLQSIDPKTDLYGTPVADFIYPSIHCNLTLFSFYFFYCSSEYELETYCFYRNYIPLIWQSRDYEGGICQNLTNP